MKKQINDLLLKMQTGENCIGETANHLLNLYNFSEWVSVIDQHPEHHGNFDVTIETKNSNIKSEAYFDGVSFKKEDVTHWKQQPKPPIKI